MTWTERQRAMLREMGLRLWLPEAVPLADGPPAALAADGPPAASAADVRQAAPAADVRQAAPAADAPRAATAAATSARKAAPPATPMPATATAPPPPPRVSVDGLGWDELRQAVAACRVCGLCQTRTQTVFGVGHHQARWLIVGEAPGEQEDLQGEPFVGAAGQLLDNMLRALQLTRASDGDAPPERRAYIANALKCRPPRNRNPEPGEMAACEPFLQRQLALLQPRIILAMGRFAIQALLRSNEPVGRLRGRVHRYQGIPLVATYHPAYLLRSLAEKARAWDDLCLAAETFAKGSP